MQVLVTLATYRQPKAAYFLKEVLENENIDCFFDISPNTEEKLDQVRVQVKSEEVERAVKVMLGVKDKYGKNIEAIEPVLDTRKIIVPTDFSPGSENACLYAIHLAQKIKAEIKLLHVYENPVNDDRIKKQMATYEEYVSVTIEDVREKAKAAMLAFFRKLQERMNAHEIINVRLHSSIVMGSMISRIGEISKIYKPDLIVLGIQGMEEESSNELAGMANEFVRRLKIPVYAIPGPVSPQELKKMNILYATDFNENDHTSLNRLLNIMEPFDKCITCIHIDAAFNPSKKERMDELNTHLKENYSVHEIHCQFIEDEDVLHGIQEFAQKNHINLLSLTTRKRSIFEKLFKPNLLKKVLQEANLPVLIFPS